MENYNYLWDHWRNMEMLSPYYLRSGRTATIVQYDAGKEEYFNRLPARVVEELAGYFLVSMRLARQKALDWLGNGAGRKPPLVLHPDLTLFPVKCRQVTHPNHTTLGYVALDQLQHVEQGTGGRTRLTFRSGNTYEVLQGKRSLLHAMNMARDLRDRYLYEQACRDGKTKLAKA